MFNKKLKQRIKELEADVKLKQQIIDNTKDSNEAYIDRLTGFHERSVAEYQVTLESERAEQRDLQYRYLVLEQVIKQLNINVTLPKRKAAK